MAAGIIDIGLKGRQGRARPVDEFGVVHDSGVKACAGEQRAAIAGHTTLFSTVLLPTASLPVTLKPTGLPSITRPSARLDGAVHKRSPSVVDLKRDGRFVDKESLHGWALRFLRTGPVATGPAAMSLVAALRRRHGGTLADGRSGREIRHAPRASREVILSRSAPRPMARPAM